MLLSSPWCLRLLRASGCTWDDTKHVLSQGNAIEDYYGNHQRADQAITESSTQQLRRSQHKRPNSQPRQQLLLIGWADTIRTTCGFQPRYSNQNAGIWLSRLGFIMWFLAELTEANVALTQATCWDLGISPARQRVDRNGAEHGGCTCDAYKVCTWLRWCNQGLLQKSPETR